MDLLHAMKAHYLMPLFHPNSVVVIGASETQGSVGARVYRNLLDAPFQGSVYGVNLRHPTVFGEVVYARIDDLPKGEIDLAIIATPARTLPGLMRECGERKVKAVLVLSRDFVAVDAHSRALLDRSLAIARQYGVRMLGPSLLGMLRPEIGLAAANFTGRAKPGNLALVSQSSSVASAFLDWAEAHEVGFSSVVSLGAAVDVGLEEVLDYLSHDPHTQGIVLYLEDVREARRLMSALRAAGRLKPIVAMKVGRYAEDDQSLALRTHSKKLIGRDEALDTALRRAGVLRVPTLVELSVAARMLAANYRAQGRRLAVISNGYGAARMAVDRARTLQVELPRLAAATVAKLNQVLPAIGSHDNPVDVLGDAPPERFIAAAEACLTDPNVDAVLVIFTPQAGTDHLATAEKMIALRDTSEKLLMLCWLGDKKVALSRKLLDRAKMAYFWFPEHAVDTFASLASYHQAQLLSLQTPGPLASQQQPDLPRARAAIASALQDGRKLLRHEEMLEVLAAFHIPFIAGRAVQTVDEAVRAAEALGLPVALKLDAEGLIHKSDIGGVRLSLRNLQEVAEAASEMLRDGQATLPAGAVRGLLVQAMHGKVHGRELMIGVARDPVFGPLIAFGAGGMMVEVFEDVALALPPLNDLLLQSLIRRTRIAQTLGAFRHLPAVDMEALKQVLLRVSDMVCELPELEQFDLNPLVVDEHGALAVDGSMLVSPLPPRFRRYDHMAIHPYPQHLVSQGELRQGGTYQIRPVRAEDAELEQHFVQFELSERSRYNRFMNTIKQLSKPMLVRFTQLDYAREMALLAVAQEEGQEVMLGVARYSANPDSESCEFAIAIGDRWHGQGLGGVLMEALFSAARHAALKTMEGEVFASNQAMLALVAKLGFEIRPHPEDAALQWVVKAL